MTEPGDGADPKGPATVYEAELRAAAGRADDRVAREQLNRTADRLIRDENLDIEELLLLSVAAMAIQTPGELVGWGRSVARRHGGLAHAVEALLESTAERQPWIARPADDGTHG